MPLLDKPTYIFLFMCLVHDFNCNSNKYCMRLNVCHLMKNLLLPPNKQNHPPVLPGYLDTVTITSPLRWGFPVHTTSLYIVQYYWTVLLSLSIDVWGGYKLLDTSVLLRLAISLTMFLSQFSVPIYYSGAIHLKGEVGQENDKKRLMDTGRNKQQQQQQRQSNLCQTERRTSAVLYCVSCCGWMRMVLCWLMMLCCE